MFFDWFDHPLIEAWLERRLAKSPNATSSTGEALAGPVPPRGAQSETSRSTAGPTTEKVAFIERMTTVAYQESGPNVAACEFSAERVVSDEVGRQA